MSKRHALAFLLVILALFVAIIVATHQESGSHKRIGQTVEEVTLVQQKKVKETLARREKEISGLPTQERQQILSSEAARLERAAAKIETEVASKSSP